jgi:hypothetical protein
VTVEVDDDSVGDTPDDTTSLSIIITDVNEPPTKPTCSSPADGATGVTLTPILESSDFSDPDAGDTHAATQWQVDDNADFSSPVWDYEDTDSDKTSQAVPSGELSYSTTYYWRVRHQDSQGAWSEWSAAFSFTTQSGLSAVYRFWASSIKRHFYTISVKERDTLISDPRQVWKYEGVAFQAFADDRQPGIVPVYRFWCASTKSHFYTLKVKERDKLLSDPRYKYEREAWYAYPGTTPAGTLPVYRFWGTSTRAHFYTIKVKERDKLLSDPRYKYEGIAWYAYGL